LQQLFGCYSFTQVVHLAAQAGVRLSVQQPEQYIEHNVKGTVRLLKAIQQQQQPASLLYASSSSVYGVPAAAAAACSCGPAPESNINTSDSNSSGSRRASAQGSSSSSSQQYAGLLPSEERSARWAADISVCGQQACN
jgi:nucleoside-diphosphate-sugar epimerase